MNKSAFWKGFLEGLAAPVMVFEAPSAPSSAPTAVDVNAVLAETQSILDDLPIARGRGKARRGIARDMAVVAGDFVRALERTR